MSRALKQLRADGLVFSDQDVAHLSPAGCEHINPYGRYHFDPALTQPRSRFVLSEREDRPISPTCYASPPTTEWVHRPDGPPSLKSVVPRERSAT
jgi:hypothetical protein